MWFKIHHYETNLVSCSLTRLSQEALSFFYLVISQGKANLHPPILRISRLISSE